MIKRSDGIDDPMKASSSSTLVRSVNLPKTSNNFRTSSGVNLHFRYFLPRERIDAVVFWVHGYGGHCNHPRIIKIAENFTSLNRALFALDLKGHGYSEGERALFRKHTEIVDDVHEFIAAVSGLTASSSTVSGGMDCVVTCIFPTITSNQEAQLSCDMGARDHDKLKKTPFFVMGNSFGGALTLFLSIKLYGHYRFKGGIMLAPSLEFKTPNPVISGLMELTYATFAPNDEMPDWVMKPREQRAITWQEEVVQQQTDLDKWGNPGALGWGHNMKWGTGLMFIRMSETIRSNFSALKSPFLIVHDPYDKVCSIRGSRDLIDQAATPSDKKVLIEVPGYFHALLLTHTDEVCDIVNDWISTTSIEK